jgi:hypothetical protein
MTLSALDLPAAIADPGLSLVNEDFPEAQAQLRDVMRTLANDIMTANIEGLQAAHLLSEKFTKFGPRKFERQDVNDANVSEAEFFGSIHDVDYSVNDLKIDVFGDIGIVTYYPRVSFVRNDEPAKVDGRQTLVFLRTDDGWKIVHEHGTVRP